MNLLISNYTGVVSQCSNGAEYFFQCPAQATNKQVQQTVKELEDKKSSVTAVILIRALMKGKQIA